ncbi:glycosyltransferase family 2 protein [Colwellia sp. MB02u-10]|uniref:glycosyltransferase family 2 protein n=1 Tax=Colwellia sp. MB02u-10 TaxID=2759828 RepID=UPI0015F3999C|nr:glycosyltransferase family 2 protein [Colwellia sp. MB02u-10]MBA6341493.1 glycosyltransferase family 2 protein [Colwellia sp. MB02u-10]
MSPSISVVIPFYHAEEYFDETYHSIKAQTLAPAEIIVVIDGCGEKAINFLASYHDITVINLENNGGPAIARNIGVKAAKGDWIAFMDADDKWKPEKLEKQMAFLASNPEFSSCHTGIITFTGQDIIKQFNNKPQKLTVTDLLISSHVVPTSWVISKQAFEKVNGFDTKIKCSEDHDLTLRLVLANENIGFLAEPLAYLRREGHGNISSNGKKIFIGHKQLLAKHKAIFNQHPKFKHKFMYKTCMTAGGKTSGLEKVYYYLLGRIIKILYNVGP